MLSADDLAETVRDFRAPETTETERQVITDLWAAEGIPNQFAAMLAASERR